MALLPTPVADHSCGLPSDGTDYQSLPNAVVALLPTPAVNDMGAAYTPETWDEWTAKMKAAHNNGNGHGKSLNVEAQRLLPTPRARDHKGRDDNPRGVDLNAALLPTPRATDGTKGGPNQRGSSGDLMLPSAVSLIPTPSAADSAGGHERRGGVRGEELLLKGMAKEGHLDRWGEYGPAIRRWESVTRPAPEPTKPSTKGNPKLSDEFDEWLMGYPSGWITEVPGVTWNETLKACGNGVMPQQGAAAVRWLVRMGQVAA